MYETDKGIYIRDCLLCRISLVLLEGYYSLVQNEQKTCLEYFIIQIV